RGGGVLQMWAQPQTGPARGDSGPVMGGDGRGAGGVRRGGGWGSEEIGPLPPHPPVRQHVEAAHPPAGPDWERVTAHYQLLSMELGPRVGGPAGAEAVDRLAAEAANLTTAGVGSGHGVGGARGVDPVPPRPPLARF